MRGSHPLLLELEEGHSFYFFYFLEISCVGITAE